MHPNETSHAIIDTALKVHRRLGPGLLESVYETVMAYELDRRGFGVERQKAVPLIYDQLVIPDAYRADLVVSESVLVELKSVESLLPLHGKQVITYLRLSGLKLGLLINFNAPLLKEGIERFVNGLPD